MNENILSIRKSYHLRMLIKSNMFFKLITYRHTFNIFYFVFYFVTQFENKRELEERLK
jgi:hypothetical protein